MVLTHCKNLCKGDYLIDDRGKNGTSEFEGEWIHFGSERFPNWDSVVAYLLSPDKIHDNVRLHPSSSHDRILTIEDVFGGH
jgi:hypothetical protein